MLLLAAACVAAAAVGLLCARPGTASDPAASAAAASDPEAFAVSDPAASAAAVSDSEASDAASGDEPAGPSALLFDRTTADLGTISEDDAPVAVEFPFRNGGTSPVVVTQVRTTCGCTIPEYPREPIRPGAGGTIRVTFHPKGHPGALHRSVRVCTTEAAANAETVLTLVGTVTPTSDPYPHFAHRMGALRLMQRQVKFGKVSAQRPSAVRIHVVNGGTRTLDLAVQGLPPTVTFRCEPAQLAPGEEGDLCFRIDPVDTMAKGDFSALVLLLGTGEPRPTECSIRLSATVF